MEWNAFSFHVYFRFAEVLRCCCCCCCSWNFKINLSKSSFTERVRQTEAVVKSNLHFAAECIPQARTHTHTQTTNSCADTHTRMPACIAEINRKKKSCFLCIDMESEWPSSSRQRPKKSRNSNMYGERRWCCAQRKIFLVFRRIKHSNFQIPKWSDFTEWGGNGERN